MLHRPARELAGIGAGIEAHELVDTDEIAELRELEPQMLPELVGVPRLLGLSAKRMRELGHSLGIRTLAELREAAAKGRLDSVPGIRPKTAARIQAALAEPLEHPAEGWRDAEPGPGSRRRGCGRARRRARGGSAARLRSLDELRRRRPK